MKPKTTCGMLDKKPEPLMSCVIGVKMLTSAVEYRYKAYANQRELTAAEPIPKADLPDLLRQKQTPKQTGATTHQGRKNEARPPRMMIKM